MDPAMMRKTHQSGIQRVLEMSGIPTTRASSFPRVRLLSTVGFFFVSLVCCCALMGCAPGRAERYSKTGEKGPAGIPFPDERREHGITGPVRRVEEKRYRQAFDGSGALIVYGSSVLTFDRSGRVTGENSYDEKGARNASTVIMRDREGRPVGKKMLSASGALEVRAAFTYDDRGRRIEEAYFSPEGNPRGRNTDEYDQEEHLVSRVMRVEYEDGSSRSTRVSYSYDAGGHLIEESYFDGSRGDMALRIEHIYRDGRLVRSADYQQGRWLEFLTFYEEDRFGNRIGERSFQIPESEYGDSFASVTSADSLPRSFLASVTTWEYDYYPE